MPNINLLDGKEYSREVEKIDLESVSFQETETITDPEEEYTEPVLVEEEKDEIPVDQPIEESQPRSNRRSSPLPLFIGIAGALIIIFLFVYLKFFRGKDTPSIPEIISTEQQAEVAHSDSTRTTEQQPINRPETITTETSSSVNLSESRKTGVVGSSLLGDFLSSFPSGMKLSFFRYGNSSYTAEFAANSTSIFDQFQQNLRAKNSSLQPKVLSDKEMLVGNQVMTIRQISGNLPPGNETPSASRSISSNNIRSDINSIANKHRLQIKQLDVSPVVNSGGNNIQLTTVKVSGNQGSLSSFIQELLNTYNNIGVNRMMISVLSASDIMNDNVMATLDLDIYLQ